MVRGSVSNPDPHSMASWICVRYSECRSGSRRPTVKRAKTEGKHAFKKQIIRHKKNKKQCNWYKMGTGNCYFIFITS
jgi:hypothetical protein